MNIKPIFLFFALLLLLVIKVEAHGESPMQLKQIAKKKLMNKLKREAMAKRIASEEELVDTDDSEDGEKSSRREVTNDPFDKARIAKIIDDHFVSVNPSAYIEKKLMAKESIKNGIYHWSATELLLKVQLYESTLIILGQKGCPHSEKA